MHSSLRTGLIFGILLVFPLACDPAQESAARSAESSAESTDRIVVIGDLHADIGVARRAFRLAGAIDESDQWIGGDLIVVQLGDIIGRSDDDRPVLDFIFDIRRKAEVGGGKIYALIGNHEVMGGRVDNQAVGPNSFADFQELQGLDLDDPRLLKLPEYQRARGAALMAGGAYAKMLAEFPVVLKLGKSIFVHGGVVPRWAEYGIENINREVSQWLLGNTVEPNSIRGVDDGDRVVWTRQFSFNVDYYDCTVLEQSLEILGAQRMIVAHTVHPEITARCDDKLWVVDVGMSRAYGGNMELLEIIDDDLLRVLRP